ncbi:MAG TPA: iron ABC transporter permease, partial [Chloroflexi bacterium]|nr:iron ABC transporter permease [Chloroflexota bacterium]
MDNIQNLIGVDTPQTRKPKWPSKRAVLMLWLPSCLVAGLILLPVLYLVLRAVQAEGAVALILRQSTLLTILRTVLLAGAVTLISTLLAVPLAWLTTRTDLPLKRLWATLTAL